MQAIIELLNEAGFTTVSAEVSNGRTTKIIMNNFKVNDILCKIDCINESLIFEFSISHFTKLQTIEIWFGGKDPYAGILQIWKEFKDSVKKYLYGES